MSTKKKLPWLAQPQISLLMLYGYLLLSEAVHAVLVTHWGVAVVCCATACIPFAAQWWLVRRSTKRVPLGAVTEVEL